MVLEGATAGVVVDVVADESVQGGSISIEVLPACLAGAFGNADIGSETIRSSPVSFRRT